MKHVLASLGKGFVSLMGIAILVIMVAQWLGFFGLIPYGKSENGRYTEEVNDPFYPLR